MKHLSFILLGNLLSKQWIYTVYFREGHLYTLTDLTCFGVEKPPKITRQKFEVGSILISLFICDNYFISTWFCTVWTLRVASPRESFFPPQVPHLAQEVFLHRLISQVLVEATHAKPHSNWLRSMQQFTDTCIKPLPPLHPKKKKKSDTRPL